MYVCVADCVCVYEKRSLGFKGKLIFSANTKYICDLVEE